MSDLFLMFDLGIATVFLKFNHYIQNSAYDCSHVTMVYNALCILLTLGDDLSRVDRASVLQGISALQCDDEPGLFRASLLSPERDMRFVYSAVASCYILDGLNVIDRDAIISFIDRSCVSVSFLQSVR